MGRVGGPLEASRFTGDKDVEWSATAPHDLGYWRALSGIVNEEPVRPVDKTWMVFLLPLGIEKGKSFDPTERQQTLLLKGTTMGELMARNLQVNPRYAEPYWPGTSWYKSFGFTLDRWVDPAEAALVCAGFPAEGSARARLRLGLSLRGREMSLDPAPPGAVMG